MHADSVDPTTAGAAAKVDLLEQRGALLRKLREFFYDRGFVEVETPLLGAEVIPELHIEPLPVADFGWLQASPELAMKRLVAAGMERVFQVTRSFRGGERGPLHAPEFTIVEWYRTGDDMHAGMELLDELVQLVLNAPPAKRTSYGEAFLTHAGICFHSATVEQLAACARQHGVAVPSDMPVGDRDAWLNLLLAACVEDKLGREVPEILYDYPASQAALATVVCREDGKQVAERFELYFRGVELANGYQELTDATELRARLSTVNEQRVADGRVALPLPESLLAAMERGLPPCAGCALGFDRLAMLALGAESIGDVMAGSDARD